MKFYVKFITDRVSWKLSKNGISFQISFRFFLGLWCVLKSRQMRYKYYVKKNEKKLMYFCITGRLELWISRIICICCNVPNIPSLPAVSNSFFLPTSTTPYFRSALSRTIIIQFHTDIHLLYVVAQICKTASSFF